MCVFQILIWGVGCQAAAPPTHLGVHVIHRYSCVLATDKFMEAGYKLYTKFDTPTLFIAHIQGSNL
jgi:hypothetical protein